MAEYRPCLKWGRYCATFTVGLAAIVFILGFAKLDVSNLGAP